MSGTIEKKQKKNEVSDSGSSLAKTPNFPTLIRTMQSEFDGLFERLAKKWPTSMAEFNRDGVWGLDVDDKEDSIVLRAETPGFEPSDFDLRVHGERLVLRANRKSETKEKEGGAREERRYYESMLLPPGVDADKIEANYQKGVLTVTIPKTAEGQGKKIEVKNP
jgi:HSP20 family protein